MGDKLYIPPEGPGTPQGDIYSLGKVLYEIITGRDRQDFPELLPPLQNRHSVNDAVISPDGQHSPAAAGVERDSGTSPRRKKAADLELFSQLLSAQKVDATGAGLEPIDNTAISNAWPRLRSKYGTSLGWTKEAGNKE